MKKTEKFETTVIHSDLRRVGAREIAVEISAWRGDDGDPKHTVKIQVWNLVNRKNYAIWLPLEAAPTLQDMLSELPEYGQNAAS